jgi:hypothetical protein
VPAPDLPLGFCKVVAVDVCVLLWSDVSRVKHVSGGASEGVEVFVMADRVRQVMCGKLRVDFDLIDTHEYSASSMGAIAARSGDRQLVSLLG